MANKDNNVYTPKSTPIVICSILLAFLVVGIILLSLIIFGDSADDPIVDGATTTTVATTTPNTTINTPNTDNTPSTSDTTSQSTGTDSPIVTDTTGVVTTSREYGKIDPTVAVVEADTTDLSLGSLVIIDKNHDYGFDESLLISRSEMGDLKDSKLLETYNFKRVNSSEFYIRKDYNQFLDADACDEFVNMLNAFAAETGYSDVYLRNAYYYSTSEEVCYNASGLYVDLQIMKEDGSYPLNYEKFKSEYYYWFTANCYKYGFIHVGEGKSSTGYDLYSSFRYVGIAHSTYMKQNNLSLENYINQIKGYSYSKMLTFEDNDGVTWGIYYVPAEADGTTAITVIGTEECYRISGCDGGGYIVTINTAYFA